MSEQTVELTNKNSVVLPAKGTPYSKMSAEDKPEKYEWNSQRIAKEVSFLKLFQSMKEEEKKERMRLLYGKENAFTFSPHTLKKTWSAFKETELKDFIIKNRLITLDDILSVGIDKFLYTIGIFGKKQVSTWQSHTVHVQACPECKDEIVAVLPEVNMGVCRKCLHTFDMDKIQRFVSKEIAKVESTESNTLMVNFWYLFNTDEKFRSVFKKKELQEEQV